MACIYFTAKAHVDVHPAIGYIKAFAEAAMVGGLADWFAVTALFRHPLGIPIPHTAIIPTNKDRIGDTMALFLKDNFLTPAVVARRMRKVDVAAAVGRFLADPDHGGAGRLRDGASKLLANLLESLDENRLGGMAKSAIATLTVITAMEMARYGVTANAISPLAATRMTADVPGLRIESDAQGRHPREPANTSPVVAWLCSEDSGWLNAVLRVETRYNGSRTGRSITKLCTSRCPVKQ